MTRVLLCTSNGVGLGHLTRMMAIGDHLRTPTGADVTEAVQPVIFTLSGAVSIPVQAGFHVEHLPSSEYQALSRGDWHRLLEDRMDQLITAYQPQVVVFDGVHPYRGLVSALHAHRRRIVRVWQRRAMWKPGVGGQALDARRWFDEVIEPGEYAEEYDRGVTAADRAGVHRTAPIIYRPESVTPDRVTACRELGLDPDEINVLVQLGAGQINDVGSLTGKVVAALGVAASQRNRPDRAPDHAPDRPVRIVVARSELSANDPVIDGIRIVSKFPISHWFAACDAAVLASGYNSFHEAMAMGLPCVWVPNVTTRTDDQDARSRWAHDHGLGVRVVDTEGSALVKACARILNDEERLTMRLRLADLAPANGAVEVARLISGWISGTTSGATSGSTSSGAGR